MLWIHRRVPGWEGIRILSVCRPGGHKNVALFLRVSLQTTTKTNKTSLEGKAVLTAFIVISKLGEEQEGGISC